ncbi:MAG: hypothetical protein QNL61_06640 [Crocinitomicaceae bacterium]
MRSYFFLLHLSIAGGFDLILLLSTLLNKQFCFNDGRRIQNNNFDVIEKFKDITGISVRRYVNDSQSCSEITWIASERAIENSGIDIESIDMIIVAHNFGDVIKGSNQTDIIPSIASRVKHRLGIKNPHWVPYDIIFGIKDAPENIMPMIIERLGNSSVAPVHTLYDLIKKVKLQKHKLETGNKILFASVGAGMNINCIVYQE